MSVEITLTNAAIKHLKKTVSLESGAVGIRLAIKNAGCSGLSYVINFASERLIDDKNIKIDGLEIFINQGSLRYLRGTQVDYITEGLNGHIKFKNPNVVNECGCGTSFQMRDAS